MNAYTKQRILSLVANDEIQAAIELLISEIPDSQIDEAILYSRRFTDLQKHIRLGLLRYEDQNVTKNQIVYGIVETIKAIEGEKSASILVAGTGKYNLSQPVYLATAALGSLLARRHFNLVCGGWEGVDYVVADTFAHGMAQEHRPLSENLVQVIVEGTEPIFKGGNLVYVKRGLREWIEAIRYADALVLIGGEGGTYETFKYAHQEGRATIPLPSTGGDAERVYHELLSNWDYWSKGPLKGIERQEMEALNLPISTEADAQILADRAMQILAKLAPSMFREE